MLALVVSSSTPFTPITTSTDVFREKCSGPLRRSRNGLNGNPVVLIIAEETDMTKN